MSQKISPMTGLPRIPPRIRLKAILPPTLPKDSDEINKIMKEFPFNAFLLYSDMDMDITEFVRLQGGLLHDLSGKDCLIHVLENPTEWDNNWEKYWEEKLGDKYSEISKYWHTLQPCERNKAFEIAKEFGVKLDSLPSIFLFVDYQSREGISIPIVISKDNYLKFFEGLFQKIHEVCDNDYQIRLGEFRKSYRKFWLKWVLPVKVKKGLEAFNDWGSLIAQTEKTIKDIMSPFNLLPESTNK